MTNDTAWKIYCWALMHSPYQCEITLHFLGGAGFHWDRWFDYMGGQTIVRLRFTLPFQIKLKIPYETEKLYKSQGLTYKPRPDEDDIPF